MADIIGWVTAHGALILAAVTAIFVAADKIVALTPSTKDDAVLANIENIVKSLGFIKADDVKPDALVK